MFTGELFLDLCFTSPVHKPDEASSDAWPHDTMSMPEFEIKTSNSAVMDFGIDTVTFDEAFKLADQLTTHPTSQDTNLVIPILSKPKKVKKKRSSVKNVYKPFASIEASEITVRQLRMFCK